MIKIIANQKVELSTSEYKYYSELEEKFGKRVFLGLFDTNKEGLVISITPPINVAIPQIVIFFLLNLQMNQRIRILDEKIDILNKKFGEKNVDV